MFTSTCQTFVEIELYPIGIEVYRTAALLFSSVEIRWQSAEYGIDGLKRVIRNTRAAPGSNAALVQDYKFRPIA